MKQIKELNIDNVVKFFISNKNIINQHLGSLNYNNIIYNYISLAIIEYFYEIKTNEFFNVKGKYYVGSPIYLNDKYSEIKMKNIYKISFEMMYPHIIYKLYKYGKIKFSIKEYGEIYCFLVKNIFELKNLLSHHNESNILLKILLNMTFGSSYLNSVYLDNRYEVIEYYNNVYNDLIAKNNIIYLDVDEIFFKEKYKDDIENDIKKLELPYKINDNISGFFIRKKKYVLLENGEIKTCGIYVNKNKTRMYTEYQKYHDDIISDFKMQLRIDKVEKLKNKIYV